MASETTVIPQEQRTGKDKIFIVIPAWNEEGSVADVVRAVRATWPNVIVVDDASGDRTSERAAAAGALLLRHLINRGQGAALKTGISYALQKGAEIIVTFDADGQHQVSDIDRLVEKIASGRHDVALGSRFLQRDSNIPPVRKAVLTLGILFTRFFSHIDVTDTHNGLRAFSRSAAKKIRIVQDRFAHASEILDEIVRNKLRYVEVPVRVTYSAYSRAKGQSNMGMFTIAFKFLLTKFFN